MPDETISRAVEARTRLQRRLCQQASPAERLARFAQLQQDSFRLLQASSDGYQHFLRRNLKSRRVKVIDGQWHPVSADRCSYQP